MIRKDMCNYTIWVFQWGGKVRIEGPEAVQKEFNRMAKEAAALSEKTAGADSSGVK